MMTTTTTVLAIRMMTSVLAPAIMYDPPTSTSFCLMLIPLQYSWFHIIFILGAKNVAMQLTDWYEYSHSFPTAR